MTVFWILTVVWVLAAIVAVLLPYTLPKHKALSKDKIRSLYAILTVVALVSLFASLFVYLFWI